MRYILNAFLLVPAVALAQDENPAEKLFRAMEKKITTAKTLLVNYESTFGEFGKLKGSLAVAEGNKVCLEQEGTIKDKAIEIKLVSDGAMMKVSGSFGAKDAKETEKAMNEKLLRFVSRGSIGSLIFQAVRTGEQKPTFEVTEFKLGKKEKVGDRAAQVVEYQLAMDKIGLVPVTLWLDVQTGLPLKRELTITAGGANFQLTESYAEFTVGGKIDAKKFELSN